jgi:3-isopropylmalate dehydrogenase
VAMMLKYSLNLSVESNAIEEAVRRTLEAGVRTKDIAGKGVAKFALTTEMGDAVAAELLKVLKEIK